MTDIWTVRSVLEWSVGYLERHEVDSPKLTADLLLADVLKCTRMELLMRYDQPLHEDELAGFRAHLKRRSKREPTQYIIGNQAFWSLDLEVDPRVLIPRADTECLVEEALELFKQGIVPLEGPFLDLCTGSGALACALAVEFPQAKIDATDLSEDALAVAWTNICNHALKGHIGLHHGDLFAPLKPKKYALIISNPPYIRSAEVPELQPEVAQYEPSLALDGGPDGLDIVRRILEQAPDFLTDTGVLLIEIGHDQGADALALASQAEAFESVAILPDYARRDRILRCMMG